MLTNLKAFFKRGSKDVPKPVLLELLEFECGVDPSSLMPFDENDDENIFRIWTSYQKRVVGAAATSSSAILYGRTAACIILGSLAARFLCTIVSATSAASFSEARCQSR